MRRLLKISLHAFAVITPFLQGAVPAQPSYAHDVLLPADSTPVACAHAGDCTRDTGHAAPTPHCDTSHGHTPAVLTGCASAPAIASLTTRIPGSPGFFFAHIPELPSRPPLAVRG